MEEYRKLGEAQKHQFGEGGPGTPPPNFNLKVPGVNAPAQPGVPAANGAAKPANPAAANGPSTSGSKPPVPNVPPAGAPALRPRPAAPVPGAATTGNSNPAGTQPRPRPITEP